MKDTIQYIIIAAPALLFAITVHEYSHAYVAYRLGDNTAKSLGRLTLNPLAHLDVIGLLVFALTRMIGWAKPIPINYNLVSSKKNGVLLVALAGPLSNIFLAILSWILYIILQITACKFLDSSIAIKIYTPLNYMLSFSMRINLMLAFFNLLPIPPLDGSKIVENFLSYEKAYKYMEYGRFGLIFIIILLSSRLLDPYFNLTVGNIFKLMLANSVHCLY